MLSALLDESLAVDCRYSTVSLLGVRGYLPQCHSWDVRSTILLDQVSGRLFVVGGHI
jgi:hypothetical protein